MGFVSGKGEGLEGVYCVRGEEGRFTVSGKGYGGRFFFSSFPFFWAQGVVMVVKWQKESEAKNGPSGLG